MSPESNGNGAAAFPGYWFKMPDELGPLMDLPPAELRVYLVVLRAIQRDRNGGLISVRQITERAKLTYRNAQSATDSLCQKGFFVRLNRKTGAILTDPREWQSRTVLYGFPPQWPQRDTSNRFPTGNQFQAGGATEAENPQYERGNRFPTGNQNRFPTGNQHLESSELRAGAPQSLQESAFGFDVVNEVSGGKLTSDDAPQKAGCAVRLQDAAALASPGTRTQKADCAAKPAAHENQNLSDKERQEQHPVPTWKQWTAADLESVRLRIAQFWGRWPSEGFELDIMYRAHAGGGAVSAAEVLSLLDRKWKRTDLRPGGRNAPHHENWFLELVAGEFYGAHMPEAAAMEGGGDPVWNSHGERRPTLADELAGGIAAIEIPDAEPVDFDTEAWQKLRAKTSAPSVPRRAPAAPATKPEVAAPQTAASYKPIESEAQTKMAAVHRPPAIVPKPPGLTPERRAEIKAMLDAAEREYRASKPPSPMPPGRESGGGLDMAAAGGLQ